MPEITAPKTKPESDEVEIAKLMLQGYTKKEAEALNEARKLERRLGSGYEAAPDVAALNDAVARINARMTR